jgi:hypothetical protein
VEIKCPERFKLTVKVPKIVGGESIKIDHSLEIPYSNSVNVKVQSVFPKAEYMICDYSCKNLQKVLETKIDDDDSIQKYINGPRQHFAKTLEFPGIKEKTLSDVIVYRQKPFIIENKKTKKVAKQERIVQNDYMKRIESNNELIELAEKLVEKIKQEPWSKEKEHHLYLETEKLKEFKFDNWRLTRKSNMVLNHGIVV